MWCRPDSALKSVAEVDRAGIRIAVNKDSAYDLFSRARSRTRSSCAARTGVDEFVKDKLEVVAGVKQALAKFVAATPGVRMIDGRFMEIKQAMGTAKGRDKGARYIAAFIEEMKAARLRRRRAQAHQPAGCDGRAGGGVSRLAITPPHR